MGHGEHLRPFLLLALLAPLVPASAVGANVQEERGEDCGATTVAAEAGAARVDAEGRRSCDADAPGDAVALVVAQPLGRAQVAWERQDGNRSSSELTVAYPPRALQWYEDEDACWMTVAAAGARDFPCHAGGPPRPPRAAWGRLLP